MTETGFSQRRTFPASDGETWWAYLAESDVDGGAPHELVFFCPATAERRRLARRVVPEWLEDVALEELRSLLASARAF